MSHPDEGLMGDTIIPHEFKGIIRGSALLVVLIFQLRLSPPKSETRPSLRKIVNELLRKQAKSKIMKQCLRVFSTNRNKLENKLYEMLDMHSRYWLFDPSLSRVNRRRDPLVLRIKKGRALLSTLPYQSLQSLIKLPFPESCKPDDSET